MVNNQHRTFWNIHESVYPPLNTSFQQSSDILTEVNLDWLQQNYHQKDMQKQDVALTGRNTTGPLYSVTVEL